MQSANPVTASLRCPTPFAFPFNPLGLSLFDTDPSRILAILHHQTLLAEEALRYRGMLVSPKDPAAARYTQHQPLFEMLSKEQDFMMKRSAALFKPSGFFRHPFASIHDLMPAPQLATTSPNVQHARNQRSTTPTAAERSTSRTPSKYTDDPTHPGSSANRSGCSPVIVDDDLQLVDEYDDDRHTSRSPRMADVNNSHKRGGTSMYKDHVRFNPMASTTTTVTADLNAASSKEKSPSSSASSSPLLLRPLPESALLQECMIEEETKCVVCNATFPSVWLLEQHAALQHANLGPMEEKPFICEQCGQSYRYRSAYVKHREQNHRARLPADKLFTCDVCGMQFRYLKSFKKHRLNHALERLHGKNERRSLEYGGSELLVTSSNEMGELSDAHPFAGIKAELADEEDDQDDTVDSLSAGMCLDQPHKHHHQQQLQQHHHHQGAEHQREDVDQPMSRMLADELHHSNISSSAEHTAMEMSVAQRQSMVGGAGMNNNLDARSFILKQPRFMHNMESVESSMPSTSSINSLINAERIPSEQALGLNPQEASILNFLRVDAAEKQRDRSRFACPFCGKCVRSKENLKLHVRKHTGERPFVCLFCGRAFGGKSDLTRHLRIHTGERPYHCEACGKCFARADYLSKHLTTHVHNSPR